MRTAKKACKECPFRKTSLGGWLGPWKTAQELLEQAFSEAGLACHTTLHQSHEEGGAPVCAGSLVCANKSAKLYRNEDLHRLQVRMRSDHGILSAQEFLQHHKKRIATVGEKAHVGNDEEV